MKLSKQAFVFFLCICLVPSVFSQENEPTRKYTFPIKPGNRNYLAGTMGELRSTHFHAGLDIKTDGVEGLPVYAIEDGYVSRIKIQNGGYGNALYVLHPNGHTSVYAHLSKYSEEVAEYIRQAQYKNEKWDIELFPQPGQFSFKRGEIIAFSGNSGSSSGPHLHFEIRDHKQQVLNPMSYQFEEIVDNTSPSIIKLALVPMNLNARVDKSFERSEYTPTRNGNVYSINRDIFASGQVGFEILAHDRQDGSSNRNGVQEIELMVDGSTVFKQNIDNFSFGQTRNILALMNYEVMRSKGSRFNRLYVADGNRLGFYSQLVNNGVIDFKEKLYNVEIHLTDTYGNSSVLKFNINGENLPVGNRVYSKYGHGKTSYEILQSTLKIKAASTGQSPFATIYANRMKHEITPAYYENDEGVYLWNLNYALPDSAVICEEKIEFDFAAQVPPKGSFQFYHKDFDLKLPTNALFDTLFLTTGYSLNADSTMEYFTTGPSNVPFNKYFTMELKPRLMYADKEKYKAYQVNGRNNYSYEGGSWTGNKYRLRTRELGTYTLLKDENPPTITPLTLNRNNLRFQIRDDLSGIDEFRLEVNGKWVLLNYDYKRKLLWSEKLDPSLPFSGEVKLVVTDNSGNSQTYSTILK